MNGPQPEFLPGYEVFTRVVDRLHDLKAQFTHLRAFSKDDFLSRHVVALEIEGPEHSDFSKLAAAIRVLVREELERYQENHPA